MPFFLKILFQPKASRSLKSGSKAGREEDTSKSSWGRRSTSHKTVGANSLTSSGSRKSNRRSKKKTNEIPSRVLEDYRSPNEKVIEAFLATFPDPAMEQKLSMFGSEDDLVSFEDGNSMPAKVFVVEMSKLSTSFPDIIFDYESIRETQPGLVLVENLRVTGTHVGAPYGFSPYPELPTTNKYVVIDPERLWWFQVKDGKVTKMDVISLGNITGPPGFYVQIGGVLTPPSS